MRVHEFIDMETGELILVEMTEEQFLSWLDRFVEEIGILEIEEEE